MRISVLALNDILIAYAYFHAAVCCEHLGKLEDAITFHQRSINITSKALGERHPSIAEKYEDIGCILARLNRKGKATAMYSYAAKLRSDPYPEIIVDRKRKIDDD
ncbi:uncharacterized protein TRIADDRAFT_60712 [Trichoplax adhaerens]|uniref:Kinesin light chain n=1 Tax=Trichoplax adhaerens TaxID=10228 RepID=B3S963_TRIAD|nr:hypothetical protein TRIADDRAFT_60712 [Trichoplax adhaerens]EDV20748.1 hypothetical protein TRIADDRAFT_60712 [Trichoplax adhaerens]|eukprot:XP_002116689.1 hypothetical protein TRIADDRAFT_60712 [Trichoplax adhaerens]